MHDNADATKAAAKTALLDSVERRDIRLEGGDRLACYHLPGAGSGLLVAGSFGPHSVTLKPLGMAALAHGRRRGLRTILVDYRGQGESSGERWSMTVPRMRDDILAVADYFGLRNCIGIGASIGAWVMLSAQQQRPDLLWSMLALAPAFDWDKTYLAPRLADGRLVLHESGKLHQPGMTMRIDPRLLETADEARLTPETIRLRGGLLSLHGTADTIADPAYADSILDVLRRDNQVLVRRLEGEEHGVSTLEGAKAQMEFYLACDVLTRLSVNNRV